MVGAVAGGRRSEVRSVNRVITRDNVLLPSMGWDVEGRGRDGRRRWSGTDGVRGAVGGGRRRTDIGESWFMVGNGVSPYIHPPFRKVSSRRFGRTEWNTEEFCRPYVSCRSGVVSVEIRYQVWCVDIVPGFP